MEATEPSDRGTRPGGGEAIRVLVLSLALVFGGAVAGNAPAGAVEEAVTTTAAGSTTAGLRRRQLARRPDALRRRRTLRSAVARLRPGTAAPRRGRSVARSVRGPPGR